MLNDTITLSGPSASSVAFVQIDMPLHVVYTGNSPDSDVVTFGGPSITQSGDYTLSNVLAYSGQPLNYSPTILVQAIGTTVPDATHSNFVSIDASAPYRLTANSDGTFTEASPFVLTFRDHSGNILTGITATGASGFAYTGTVVVAPEPASFALLALAAPLLARQNRDRYGKTSRHRTG